MAKQSKGQKYGRNRDRNPSSKQQKLRSERNKRRRIEAAPKKGIGHLCPKHPNEKRPLEFVTHPHSVPEYRVLDHKNGIVLKHPKLIVREGVTVDVVR